MLTIEQAMAEIDWEIIDQHAKLKAVNDDPAYPNRAEFQIMFAARASALEEIRARILDPKLTHHAENGKQERRA